MLKITQPRSTLLCLEYRSPPIGAWLGAGITLFSLVFIVVGFSNFTQGGWLFILGGSLFLYFGAAMVWQYFRYQETCLFDKAQKVISLSSGVHQRHAAQYAWGHLQEIRLGEDSDSDGDPVYHLEMILKSHPNQPLRLTCYGNYDRQELEQNLHRIRTFLE